MQTMLKSIVARLAQTLSQPVNLEVGSMMPLTVAWRWPRAVVHGLWRGLQMWHMAIFQAWSGRWDTMADAGRLTERYHAGAELFFLTGAERSRKLVRQGCVAVEERSAISGEVFGFRVAVVHRVCAFCPTLGG